MKKIIVFLFVTGLLVTYAQNISDKLNYKISTLNHFIYPVNQLKSDYLLTKKLNQHSIINISGQVVAGSAVGFVFTLPVVYGAFLASFNHKPGLALDIGFSVLFYSSYIFGTALGVDWIASKENPNNSLFKTLEYSAIGSGVSFILISILASSYLTVPPVGVFLIAICPVISSVMYTTFISDWPIENNNDNGYKSIRRNYSYKDLIDNSMIIKINAIQINL